MAKKIRIISCIVIIAIVVIAYASLSIYDACHVSSIDEVNMTNNTATTVNVEWKQVHKAYGYRIYVKNNESGEYELASDVEGEKTTECELSDLKSATVYDIRVMAYKVFRNKSYESEDAFDLKIYTLPDKELLTVSSDKEGVLDLQWDNQENASGYEVEYTKDSEFKDTESEDITSGDTTEFKAEGLTPKDVYYSRVRAYYYVDDQKIYGEWSETGEITIKKKVVMASNIDPSKPMVALSFDDGPGYLDDDNDSTTNQILDILEEYGARATFFMCGYRISNSNVDCLKREIKLGCELGNHTYSHKYYGKNVTADEIKSCSDKIKQTCGQAPTIFRCPGGIMTNVIQNECKKEGMPIAYWSIDTEDWESQDPDEIYKRVMDKVYDGSIILMHDIYPTTVEAVEKVVPKLIEDGYQVVTVSEMLTAKNQGKEPLSGQQYVDYKTINNNT